MRSTYEVAFFAGFALAIAGCGGTSAEDKARIEELTASMPERLQRLASDTTYTQADLDAFTKDMTELVDLADKNQDVLSSDTRARVATVRDFLQGASIGVADVDAKGSAVAADIEPGWSLRVDVMDGQWTAKDAAPEFPTTPGTGYPDWVAKKPEEDFRACSQAPFGALVATAGGSCFASGKWYMYSGKKDPLTLRMNDNDPADNAGSLKVRWVLFRRQMP